MSDRHSPALQQISCVSHIDWEITFSVSPVSENSENSEKFPLSESQLGPQQYCSLILDTPAAQPWKGITGFPNARSSHVHV
jgi:hypothetical protein